MTLEEDYRQFMAAGGDIRNAKNHNNVIAPYFFEVPLDQVNTNYFTCNLVHTFM